MAKWEIDEEDIINYSPNGDDIDTFSQKVKQTFEKLYLTLNNKFQPITVGKDADKPLTGNESYDLYFAEDTFIA